MANKECTKCIHNAVCKTADSCDGYVSGCKHFNPGWISVDEPICGAIWDLVEYPTVYAVEVVRCKDCKKFVTFVEPYNKAGQCRKMVGLVGENDFCSYGERRSE